MNDDAVGIIPSAFALLVNSAFRIETRASSRAEFGPVLGWVGVWQGPELEWGLARPWTGWNGVWEAPWMELERALGVLDRGLARLRRVGVGSGRALVEGPWGARSGSGGRVGVLVGRARVGSGRALEGPKRAFEGRWRAGVGKGRVSVPGQPCPL